MGYDTCFVFRSSPVSENLCTPDPCCNHLFLTIINALKANHKCLTYSMPCSLPSSIKTTLKIVQKLNNQQQGPGFFLAVLICNLLGKTQKTIGDRVVNCFPFSNFLYASAWLTACRMRSLTVSGAWVPLVELLECTGKTGLPKPVCIRVFLWDPCVGH